MEVPAAAVLGSLSRLTRQPLSRHHSESHISPGRTSSLAIPAAATSTHSRPSRRTTPGLPKADLVALSADTAATPASHRPSLHPRSPCSSDRQVLLAGSGAQGIRRPTPQPSQRRLGSLATSAEDTASPASRACPRSLGVPLRRSPGHGAAAPRARVPAEAQPVPAALADAQGGPGPVRESARPRRQGVQVPALLQRGAAQLMAHAGRGGSAHVLALEGVHWSRRGSQCCLAMPACLRSVEDWALAAAAEQPAGAQLALPEARVLPVFQQMAAGVAACHAQGVLHSDVKPANFLMASAPRAKGGCLAEGAVKLADFGFAVEMGGREEVALKGYTPAYQAPEAEHSGRPGLPADVWALGASLWMLLCDPEDHNLVLLRTPDFVQGLEEGLDASASVSQPTRSLLAAMLSPDPHHRPTAQQLLQRLQSHPLLHSAAPQARTTTTASRIPHLFRRRAVVPVAAS